MSETAMRVECTECGGSGHGPDRCDGPGDVYQDKCGRCDGRGLEPTGKTDALAVVVTDLEPESALAIRGAFGALFDQVAEWTRRAREIRVTSLDDKRGMKLARESRLAVRDVRIEAEHARKRLKSDIVRRGKAIDGAANIIKDLLEPIEVYLLEQETFAARHEQARKDALRAAREEALRALGTDPAPFANLGETDEETWASTLQDAKDAHAARLEAAREAEAVRVEAERIVAEKREAARVAAAKEKAEREEKARAQAEENARLKAERDALEARFASEREAEREAAEHAAASARAVREAVEEEARKARAEQERAERELAAERARADAERRAEEERQAAAAAEARAAELAPDREKLLALARTVRALQVPELATEAGRVAGAKVAEQLAKMAAWIEKTGGAL